jgi:hypothetical protein
MSSAAHHATVTVTARSLWRIRISRELPRYLLQALALAGLLASARFVVDPPRPVIVRPAISSAALPDLAAEGFASLFARLYLTWNSHDPEAQSAALAPFVGSSLESNAGLQPPTSGTQQVQWTQVVQAREPAPGEHVYTVAAETDPAGLLYLTVSVVREADGKLALAGYPAFVGPPAFTVAESTGRLREVEDPALTTVITRALRNYLARSETELAADLAAGARVSLPDLTLTLQSVHSLDWSTLGRSVLAVVQVQDERGAQYTLGYELDVVANAGRWEVSSIQMNPNT